MSISHLIIPDTQVKPGVPLQHLTWAGDYLVDKRPDVVVHLGDHWDMPSLSSYDRGMQAAEGRTYADDVAAGNMGMQMLLAPLRAYQKTKEGKNYKPRLVFLMGNHCERIKRHINANPHLDGKIGYKDLDLSDWEVHDFLEVVEINGIRYSHYFAQMNTGKAHSAQAGLRLQKLGFSFTMGHQQGKQSAERFLNDGTGQRAMIAGSFYLHQEDYKGHQGNHHWNGVILKHEVKDGNYDLLEVSTAYLERRYKSKHPKASHAPVVYKAANMAAIQSIGCPACGSTKTCGNGVRATKQSGSYQRRICQQCGTNFKRPV